jgi:hypothetical protein
VRVLARLCPDIIARHLKLPAYYYPQADGAIGYLQPIDENTSNALPVNTTQKASRLLYFPVVHPGAFINILKYLFAMRIVFLLLILIVSFRISAQDTTHSRWNQQMKQSLSMRENQYARFIKAGTKYDAQVAKIMRDSSLDRNSKMEQIDKVLTEKRAVIKQILTEDQIKKLAVLEKQRAIAKGSRYYKHRQELEARMMQRKLDRGGADSTRIKPPSR